jgi:hypothetical protein
MPVAGQVAVLAVMRVVMRVAMQAVEPAADWRLHLTAVPGLEYPSLMAPADRFFS